MAAVKASSAWAHAYGEMFVVVLVVVGVVGVVVVLDSW